MNFFSSIFGGDDNRELNYLKVTGKYSFHVEPIVKGILPYHSSSVMITCHKDSRKLCPIDFKCEWYRLIEDRQYKIEDLEEKSYHFTPYDIGISIKVVVSSMSVEFPGHAHIVFGPIKMDYVIRPQIKDLVIAGKGEFNVKLVQYDELMVNDVTDFENKVLLNRNEIVIVLLAHQNVEPCMLHVPFEKSIAFRLEPDNYDSKTLSIIFDQEERERHVKVQFPNCVIKDIFIMSMRVIKSLRVSCITDMVNNYGKILSKEWLPKKLNPEDGDEYFERFQADTASIKTALKMTVTANKELSAENEELHEYIEIIEADLAFSIKEFASLLQEMKTKSAIDVKRYEESNRSIAADSSQVLANLRNNPNSSFNIKRSAKGQNVHNRKIFEIEQLNTLQTELENAKRLNTILETEFSKIRANKGMPVLTGATDKQMGNSLFKDGKAGASINLHKSKRGQDQDDEDSSLGLSLENVLADLEDVDYITYAISKDEIEMFKETMKLRMDLKEEMRTHDVLKANIDHVKSLKQSAIANKTSFNLSELNLPEEARHVGLSSEEKLLQLVKKEIKENHRLTQLNFEGSKANLINEQSCDELIELKLKYLLKKNSTLDEQSEKAEEELTMAIIQYFINGTLPGPTSSNNSPSNKNEKKEDPKVIELQNKLKKIQEENAKKSKILDEEKTRNVSIKSQLERAIVDKKAYSEKAEILAKLQAEIGDLTKRLEIINKENTEKALPVI